MSGLRLLTTRRSRAQMLSCDFLFGEQLHKKEDEKKLASTRNLNFKVHGNIGSRPNSGHFEWRLCLTTPCWAGVRVNSHGLQGTRETRVRCLSSY